jgi:Do/DeqQ family serine protease
LIFTQAVTVLLAAFFVVVTLKPEWLHGGKAVWQGGGTVTLQQAPATPPAAGSASGLALAARAAMPSVVSITASKAPVRNDAAEDPVFRFFHRDLPPREGPGTRAQIGLGSGVIVSREGHLLTNHHVIDGATEIEVKLADGRQASASLVGSDPETDLAVLKIDLDALPVATLGDAQALQVGDAVLAIGHPFNVGLTVTAGIVSALNRNRLGLSTFEDFIQTDAAINRGNSGGALVDARGVLVGINTAIFSPGGGGSVGIGFAVPTDTARDVLQAIVGEGRVVRGWIGVEPRDLNAELAESLGLGGTKGVLITGVLQDGPAARAGLKPGDVITAIDGSAVADSAELLRVIARLPPGQRATLSLRRERGAVQIEVTLGQRPARRAS